MFYKFLHSRTELRPAGHFFVLCTVTCFCVKRTFSTWGSLIWFGKSVLVASMVCTQFEKDTHWVWQPERQKHHRVTLELSARGKVSIWRGELRQGKRHHHPLINPLAFLLLAGLAWIKHCFCRIDAPPGHFPPAGPRCPLQWVSLYNHRE